MNGSKERNGNQGWVDILYQHADERAFLWEVKAGNAGVPKAVRQAAREVQHYIKAYRAEIGQTGAPGEPMQRTRRVPYVPRSGRDYHYVYSPGFNTDGAVVYVRRRPQRPRQRPPHPVPLPRPAPAPQQKPQPQQPRTAPETPGVNWGDVATGAGVVAAGAILGLAAAGTGGLLAGALFGGGVLATS